MTFGLVSSAWLGERNESTAGGDGHNRRLAVLDTISLHPRHLYELFGEASAGKTQLCLQLVVLAVLYPVLSDLPSSPKEPIQTPIGGFTYGQLDRAVYLFTEGGTMKMDRLRQIAFERLQNQQLADLVMRHVHVEYASTVDDVIAKLLMMEDLLKLSGTAGAMGGDDRNLSQSLPSSLSRPPVRLLVLDSIAHVFRFKEDVKTRDGHELGAKNSTYDSNRTNDFFKIATILKRYADEYNLVVLVTNHVVDAIHDENGSDLDIAVRVEDRPGCAGLQLETSGRCVYPALGLAWASCVTSRLFVSRETAFCQNSKSNRAVVVEERDTKGKQLRGIQVVFSPELKQVKTHFVIETRGCIGVDIGTSELHLGSKLLS
jgi:DNA-repair protein XRCC3